MKPLGMRAYGHIGHLPNSRMGPGDHHCHEGQARICTEKVRDRHDMVVVQEKLDGSCMAVARMEGRIVALNRAGYLAATSPYPSQHLFAGWVEDRQALFLDCLTDGERMVGEWLAQAVGTRYALAHEPFVVFDLMAEHRRATVDELRSRVADVLPTPHIVHRGGPVSVAGVCAVLAHGGGHGALDPVEGAVWRVERRGRVDFLAKWVRPDKVDGCYLPEVSGGHAIWNDWPRKGLDHVVGRVGATAMAGGGADL